MGIGAAENGGAKIIAIDRNHFVVSLIVGEVVSRRHDLRKTNAKSPFPSVIKFLSERYRRIRRRAEATS